MIYQMKLWQHYNDVKRNGKRQLNFIFQIFLYRMTLLRIVDLQWIQHSSIPFIFLFAIWQWRKLMWCFITHDTWTWTTNVITNVQNEKRKLENIKVLTVKREWRLRVCWFFIFLLLFTMNTHFISYLMVEEWKGRILLHWKFNGK